MPDNSEYNLGFDDGLALGKATAQAQAAAQEQRIAALEGALNMAYAWALDDMHRHPADTDLLHQRRAMIRAALSEPTT